MKNKRIRLNIYFIILTCFVAVGFTRENDIYDANKLINPGKIWLSDNHILINEKYRGIHIYNIEDMGNPVHAAFIEIENNIDMAVKDCFLFADSKRDLFVYDISSKSNPQKAAVLKNMFYSSFQTIRRRMRNGNSSGLFCSNNTSEAGTAPSNQNSQGGSMAKFTISGDYLYCLNPGSIVSISIADPYQPEKISEKRIDLDSETIFPYKDKLFIGSQTGMSIYSITNPKIPAYISRFRHGRSCDPVAVYGNYAYVTLRSGSACGGASNQLDIIDISDLINPKLVSSYGLTSPYGLTADEKYVYVCDGEGLRILNIENINNIYQENIIKDIGSAYDVILSNNRILHITSNTGIHFYNAMDVNSLKPEGDILKG